MDLSEDIEINFPPKKSVSDDVCYHSGDVCCINCVVVWRDDKVDNCRLTRMLLLVLEINTTTTTALNTRKNIYRSYLDQKKI